MRVKHEVLQAIKEILIQSQYRFWVLDHPEKEMTATEINAIEKDAIDYYLGRSKPDPMKLANLEQTQFHHFISMQEALICRELDKVVIFKD